MTDTWQQAVDPELAARLWRRGERPGLISHEPAVSILARHQGMVSGLPLADMLLRRQEISNDPGVALDAPLPVVTAALPRAAVPGPAGPAAPQASAAHDSARSAPAAVGPAGSSPTTGPTAQPIRVTPVRSGDVVVQRMPAQAAAMPLAPPQDAPLADDPLAGGVLGEGPLTGGPRLLPADGAPPDGPRIRAVPDLRQTADVPRELPRAEQGPGGASPAAMPVVVAAPVPDQRPVTAARPLVLVSAPERSADPGSPPLGGTGDREYATDGHGRGRAARAATVLVVRERPRAVTGPEPGLAADRRRAPLPLAGIPVPGTADSARPPWPPQPAPQHAPSPAQPRVVPGTQGHPAQQRNGPVRPQPQPDAGRIAETVRRRFLRELSVEAERRGAGWES